MSSESWRDGQKAIGFEHQADASISQANPVSTTLYTVLDTTSKVRILGIFCDITWATTQPTPLEVVITIDGQTLTFSLTNPVSGTPYYVNPRSYTASGTITTADSAPAASFILEGRSVKVQIRITWATTQPTPLVCRVKYARIT